MWQKKTRFACHTIFGFCPVIFSLLSVLVLTTACSPLLPPLPPQPGQVLYALYVPLSQSGHSTASTTTLMATAMHSNTGQAIWQTSVLSGSVAASIENAVIIAAGSLLFVTASMPQQKNNKGIALALDAQTGQQIWQTTLDGALVSHALAVQDNLYVVVDNRVEALNGSNGDRLWSISEHSGYFINGLVESAGTLYVEEEADFLPAAQTEKTTYDSAILSAFHLNNGTEIWQREVANTLADSTLSLVGVSIQADEHAVYVLRDEQVMEIHGNDGELVPRYTLVALDAQNGEPLWSDPTQQPSETDAQFSLALFNQTLYIVGVASPGTNTLSALQSQNGKQLWSWQTPFIINPFVPPNHIYGSSLNKGESFCALRSNDGGVAWCSSYNQLNAPVLFSQGKIYLYASLITYQDASSSPSEQPDQIYVLNEKDGSVDAHYTLNHGTGLLLENIALS